jgi:hypothetical protein
MLCLVVVGLIIKIVRVARRNMLIKDKQTYDLPIVCICKIEDRVGFVLRREYDKASQDFWKPYRTGKVRYDHGGITARYGRYLEVPHVFVRTPFRRI